MRKGTIPNCVHIRQAVDRRPAEEYHFCDQHALRALRFVEYMVHTKGPKANEKFILEPWECWLVAEIFGWVDDTGRRCYRTAYIEIPRKNGKTSFAAAISLYMLVADGEAGAECYTAAAHQEQASISFGIARQMVLKNSILRESASIRPLGGITYAGLLVLPDGSLLKPLPQDRGGSLDGLNPSFALLDEVHAYRTPDVYDALALGMGARDNPLLLAITTAGYGLAGVGHQLSKMTKRAISGQLDLPRHFGAIWTYDEGDDVWDESTWAKANPNLGVSIQLDYLEAQARIAKTSPEKERAFVTKHLNGWLTSDISWLSSRQYRACACPLNYDDLYGKRAWAALDLATTKDLASLMVCVETDEGLVLFGEHHAPSKVIEANSIWQGWAQDGWITGHSTRGGGEAIDEMELLERMIELGSMFDLQALAYDDWTCRTLAQLFEDRTGVEIIKFTQTAANFNRPMRAFEAGLASKDLIIENDPCLEWQFGNVVTNPTHAGHLKPLKSHPDRKIDGAVAGIMAYGVAYDSAFENEPQGAIDLWSVMQEMQKDKEN